MKFATPEIAWHNKDPVYSIDIQHSKDGVSRLASCGTDKDVRIWSIFKKPNKAPQIEFLSTLTRHQKAVNVVRFSPDGQLLASGGDDCCVIVWKAGDTSSIQLFDEEDDQCKEKWNVFKVLRNHLEDILDISWSSDGQKLVSGSVDNTAIIWDVQKGCKLWMYSEHKSFVQGVAFDPLDKYVATMSCDRSLRVFQLSSNSLFQETRKLSSPSKSCRMFHDDSMKSFFRRLSFSPDGKLLIVPSGCLEVDANADLLSTTYIFAREDFTKPIAYLPLPQTCKTSLAVRFCPRLFKLWRAPRDCDNKLLPDLFQIPYRMVFAVITDNSLIVYDTQFTRPIAYLSDIHYHTLSDISWSDDGSLLVVSSTDGYCTLIGFEQGELGEPYKTEELVISDEINIQEVHRAEDPTFIKTKNLVTNYSMPLDEKMIGANTKSSVQEPKIDISSEQTLKQGGNRKPRRMTVVTLST